MYKTIFLCLCCIVVCSSSMPVIHDVIVLGDSRAAGFYVNDAGVGREGNGWPRMLERQLGTGWQVRNFSIRGARISAAVDFLRAHPSLRPTAVVLQYGWNEAAKIQLGRFPVPSQDEWRAALREVQEWCRARNAQLIVLDAPSPAYYEGHPGGQFVAQLFGCNNSGEVIDRNRALQAAAREVLGPAFMDTGLTVEDFPPSDFVHPNLSGHKRIEAAVEAAIRARMCRPQTDGALAEQ